MEIEKEIHQKKFKDNYEKTMINILFTGNWLSNMNNQFLNKFDLSIQQYNVLRILRGQSPEKLMLNDIQKRMLDRMSNASRLVDKLKRKDLVERKECKHDRRKVDIWITEKGLSLLKEIDEELEGLQSFIHNISIEETQILNKILDKLRSTPSEALES